jgi:hypothetical protein
LRVERGRRAPGSQAPQIALEQEMQARKLQKPMEEQRIIFSLVRNKAK